MPIGIFIIWFFVLIACLLELPGRISHLREKANSDSRKWDQKSRAGGSGMVFNPKTGGISNSTSASDCLKRSKEFNGVARNAGKLALLEAVLFSFTFSVVIYFVLKFSFEFFTSFELSIHLVPS